MANAYAATHHHQLHPSDLQVVDIVLHGDVEAFEVLVDRYHGELTRHLAYRLGDPELAADLTQETFLDAFRRLDHFDGHRSFAAWLFGIARKRLLMHRRHQRLRRLISLDWLTGADLTTPPALQQDDESESCHDQDKLFHVFSGLTPSLCEALLLHSLDGFTAPEIAGILGISRSAAERRISRAKEQFRQLYRDHSDDEKGLDRG